MVHSWKRQYRDMAQRQMYVLAGRMFHEFTAGMSEVSVVDMAEVLAFL